MRNKKRLSVYIIIGIALLLIFLTLSRSLLKLPFGFNFARTERKAYSTIILKEMRDVFLLTTVEYVFKTVFPHDYLPPDRDIENELRLYRKGNLVFPADDVLGKMLALSSELGFDLNKMQDEFVIVTVILKAGFNLESVDPEDIFLQNERENSITVKMPVPVITGVTIDDTPRTQYNYPDIPLSPEKWKRVAAFVTGQVTDLVLHEGFLDIALQNGKDFLKNLLKESGWDQVNFIDPQTAEFEAFDSIPEGQ